MASAPVAKQFVGRCALRADKSARHQSGRGRAQGEGWEDVTVTGTLPLDQDKASGTCKYGHELFVVRRGSETAAHYGIM